MFQFAEQEMKHLKDEHNINLYEVSMETFLRTSGALRLIIFLFYYVFQVILIENNLEYYFKKELFKLKINYL
jgi:hypothetical protein